MKFDLLSFARKGGVADVIYWAGCFKTSSDFTLDDPAGLDGPALRSTPPMMQSCPTLVIASVTVQCVSMCEVT